jgi:hypothetical protein
MSNKIKRSGEGEISAVGGFVKQYEYSACVIYNAMQGSIFDSISLTDPAAGMLDDLLVKSKDVVHATQVKTHTNASAVALNTQLMQVGWSARSRPLGRRSRLPTGSEKSVQVIFSAATLAVPTMR